MAVTVVFLIGVDWKFGIASDESINSTRCHGSAARHTGATTQTKSSLYCPTNQKAPQPSTPNKII
jgi:hypothetical protein